MGGTSFNQALAFACHSLSIFKCYTLNGSHVHFLDTFDVATALACLCSSSSVQLGPPRAVRPLQSHILSAYLECQRRKHRRPIVVVSLDVVVLFDCHKDT